MNMTEEASPAQTVKKKSLLEKYDIPIAHLDFEYVNKCRDIKELERIVKILRSNEEGYFPDLTKCAEDQLRSLAPGHSILRKDSPVLDRSSLSKQEWSNVLSELEDWKCDMLEVERDLSTDSKSGPVHYPEVRKSANFEAEKKEKEKKGEKIKSWEYDKWNEYDADAECVKMDVEEDKREEQREKEKRLEEARRKKEAEEGQEAVLMEELRKSVEPLSERERQVLALKEKELGNEFYKCHELKKAVEHYSRSIAIFPTAVAHNNRAATYLKQCKFGKALEDTNIVLSMEPNNVKAYYRRALSLQHKNEFHKALDDIREVLRREPNHVEARHIADQLREHCVSLPKKFKLMMKDSEPNNNPNNMKVVEVTKDEMLNDYKDKNFVEVNDWGLAKIMCNCTGRHSNEPGIQHESKVRYQHLHSPLKPVRIEEVVGKEDGKKLSIGGDGDKKMKRIEIVEHEKLDKEEAEEVAGCQGDVILREPIGAVAPPENQSTRTARPKLVTPSPSPKLNKDTANTSVCKDEKGPSGRGASGEGSKREKTKTNEERRDPRPPEEEFAMLNMEPTPIMVAKKYREKVSGARSRVQETAEPNSSDGKKPIGIDTSPQQFWHNWSTTLRSADLRVKAKLLRSVRPHLLQAVIGNKLDDKMLGELVRCLGSQFNIQTEAQLIVEYLTAIAQLERFSIIYSFLDADQKSEAHSLLERLGSAHVNHKLHAAFA